jgi:hypothetical protein
MGVGNENEYEKKESILKAKDIFECLQRRSNQSLVFEDVLDAISYSKYVGFIPFGVQPTDGPSVGSIQTPQIKNFKASQVFWDVLLESTSLCSYTSEEERKNALKILLLIEKNQQEQQESIEIKETWQSIEELRKRFYLERSIYFDIRIEIFRIALFTSSDSLQQHPNRRLTERLVEYFLLKENLVQNLLSELNARQKMKARDLLTEIELKGSLKASIDSISMKKFRGHMRHAWDEQFVQEYTQLLELLLLALYASKGDIGLPILMRLARFFHDANFSLPMELFAKSSLSLEIFQSKLKRVTALSTMLLVSVISMLPMASNILENQLIDVTESFFLGEFRQKALGIEIFPSKINEEGIDIDTSILSMEEEEFGVNSGTMQPQGFVFLAFASLLGRLCNVASSTLRTEVEQKAREILSLAHSLQGFTYFHTVLQVLIQSEQKSFMNSFDPNAKCWQLPQGFLLSSSSFTTIPTAQAYMQQQVQAYTQPVFNFNGSLAIYQQVAVGFLKDVLGPLGFDASLEDPHQFQVMVQMISPALCHPQIAESILSQKDEAASNILVKFLLKGKQFASCRGGNNFLPLLKLYTSLVSGIRSSSSSSQWSLQIVHDLTVLEVQGNDRMRHHTTAFSTGTNRLLPPEHFLIRDFRSDQIVASSTFAYPEDNLVIPQGTIGLVNSKGLHGIYYQKKTIHSFFQRLDPCQSTYGIVSYKIWKNLF